MGAELPQGGASGAPAAAISWGLALFIVWSAGALRRAALELRASFSLGAHLRRLPRASETVRAMVRSRSQNLGIATALSVRTARAGTAPFLAGLWTPCLALPEGFGRRAGDEAILDHELVHARRADMRVNALMRVVGVLVWFNPFWFALERRRRLAVELACDAAVMRRLEPGRARLYARALLDAVKADSGPPLTVGFGVAYKEALKMRLSYILKPAPKADLRRLAAGLAGACCLIVSAGGAQTALAAGRLTDAPVFTHSVLEGRITSTYGPRSLDLPVPRFHGGLDIAAPLGTPIQAPAGGTIAYAGDNYRGSPNWGHVIVIDHGNGWATLYAHLGDMHVSTGDRVSAGQRISQVGMTGLSTGPHLHVEVLENGERRDPAQFLPGLAAHAQSQD